MSCKSNFDTIVFQYSGSKGDFHEEYTFPNEKYEVTISSHSSSKNPLVRNSTHGSSKLFHLTIKWNEMRRKLIRLKVRDIVTSKLLLKEKFMRIFNTLMVHKNVALEKKSVLCIIEIYTYEIISKVKNKAMLTEPKKSDKAPLYKTEFEPLSSNVKSLLETGEFSDVTITDGDNNMHLHKLILSARSSVFHNMFQHSTEEMQKSIIKISDIPFQILKKLVDYIYSGVAIIESMETARDLFVAADKYDITGLKEVCLAKLKCVSLDNVLDNLLLANMYGEKELMDVAFTYISNNFTRVQNLQQWNKLRSENKDLAIGILSYLLNINKSETRKC